MSYVRASGVLDDNYIGSIYTASTANVWSAALIDVATAYKYSGFRVKKDNYSFLYLDQSNYPSHSGVASKPFKGSFTFSPKYVPQLEFTITPALPEILNWKSSVNDYTLTTEEQQSVAASSRPAMQSEFYIAQHHRNNFTLCTGRTGRAGQTNIIDKNYTLPHGIKINGIDVISQFQNPDIAEFHNWGLKTTYTSLVNTLSLSNRGSAASTHRGVVNGETGEVFNVWYNTELNIIEALTYLAPIYSIGQYWGAIPFRYALLTIAINNDGSKDRPIYLLEGINEDGTTTKMDFIGESFIDLPNLLVTKQDALIGTTVENFGYIYPIFKDGSESTRSPFILGRFGNIKFNPFSMTNGIVEFNGELVIGSKFYNFPDISIPLGDQVPSSLTIAAIDNFWIGFSGSDTSVVAKWSYFVNPATSSGSYLLNRDIPELLPDNSQNPEAIDYEQSFYIFQALAQTAANEMYASNLGSFTIVSNNPELSRQLAIEYYLQRIMTHFDEWCLLNPRPTDMATFIGYAS